MATSETIFKCFKLLARAYPAQAEKLPAETPKLYEQLLVDIPDDILEAATLDHISNSDWFPMISQLRSAAVNITTGVDQFQLAAEAWGDVCRLIIRYGRDREPEIENPITAQTIKALGWRSLCMSTNQVADRARFIQAYDLYLQRYKRGATTLPQVRALAAKLRMPGLRAGHLPALPFGTDNDDESGETQVEALPDYQSVWDRGQGE